MIKKSLTFTVTVLLLLITISSFVISSIEGNAYELVNSASKYANPSSEHLFGCDYLGRDIFARVVLSIRNSIVIALISTILSVSIGCFIGTISGSTTSNSIRAISTTTMNVLYSIPEYLIAIVISTALKNNANNSIMTNILSMALTISIVAWVPVARIISDDTLRIMNNEYITYSKLKGASRFHVVFFHVLPNLRNLIILTAVQRASSTVFMESFLSFIGIGVQPPLPSLGLMITEGIKYARSCPHMLLAPALSLFAIIFLLNCLSEQLQKKE